MSKPIDPKTLGGIFHKVWADYDATRQSRFIRKRTGVAPQGGSEDYNFRQEIDYYNLIEQARDMDRNDGLVGTLADRRVDNIVQQGFTLDTKTGDKKLDLDLWQRWQAFSNDPEACDIAGELCWHEIERLVCRAESIDGDIVVVGTEEGSYQTIEAHAIQTSTRIENTFLGVTRDIYGRREQYHVRYDLNEFGQKSESMPIDVRDENGVRQLFHVYDPKRVSGTRGVTQLAPVFALSGMLEDINFAKLVQQQIVSCFAILRSRAPGVGSGLPGVVGTYGEPGTETTRTGSRVLEGISPGMEIEAEEGETLSGFSPNVPNSEYFQQVRLIMQIVGVNFGLPLCLVLMDGSETNFSGWRGAVDEARKGFVADQMNLVRRLHTPAYTWWLHREMAMDASLRKAASRAGISIFGHQWQLPTWSYIEPVADAEGDTAQLRNALTSPRRMHAARGKDWETIAEEIIDDNVYAISAAQAKADQVNKTFPDAPPLSWRDLIPLPMPEGQTLAMQDPNAIKAQEDGQDVDGQPVEQLADTDSDGEAVAALNGAQVASLTGIVTQVAGGLLNKESAKALLAAAFPQLSTEVINGIIDPVEVGSVESDDAIDVAVKPTGRAKRPRIADFDIEARGSKQPRAARAKKKEPVALSESEQETRLLAEIMLHVFGDDAEELMFAEGPVAAFDESKIKRGSDGRFAEKGSAKAFSAAKDTLAKALKGKKTPKSAEALASKLSNLTVKQLTELKKEYGIKASGRTKQQLVDKLADRLDRGRRQAEQKKKTVKKKAPSKKKEAEKRAVERREAEKPSETTIDEAEFKAQTKQQQQQAFREAVIKEFDATQARLSAADSSYFSAVSKEVNVVQDIDKQTMRLAKAEQRLAKNPDDAKAQNEARIAKQRLASLETKLQPARAEMQRTKAEQQQAQQQRDTALTRMMSGHIDRVNGTEQAKAEAAEKLAAVKEIHQTDGQIAKGEVRASFFFKDTAEQHRQVAAKPHVIAERKKGEQVLTEVANARFHAKAMTMPLVYQAKERAHAMPGMYVMLDQNDAANTYLHEYGHQIEFGNKKAEDLVDEFLTKRVGNEPLQSLAEKFPESKYDPDEVGRKDDFVKTIQAVYGVTEKSAESRAYYIGKEYGTGATEVLSMGVELLTKNAAAFAKADPEYFDLVVGILSGQMLED